MFHVEHFMKTKIQHFVKEIKLRANPIIEKNKLISFMKFQRAFHRLFSLKRFSKMSFNQETKISPFAKEAQNKFFHEIFKYLKQRLAIY